MTESHEGHKTPVTLTSATAERNRIISWEGAVQGSNEKSVVTPSSKNSITIRTLSFVIKVPKLFDTSLSKLPYKLFNFGYEIAKLVTRGLLSIRRLKVLVKLKRNFLTKIVQKS